MKHDRKCQRCRTYLPLEARYCPNCGLRATSDARSRRPGRPSGGGRGLGVLLIIVAIVFVRGLTRISSCSGPSSSHTSPPNEELIELMNQYRSQALSQNPDRPRESSRLDSESHDSPLNEPLPDEPPASIPSPDAEEPENVDHSAGRQLQEMYEQRPPSYPFFPLSGSGPDRPFAPD